MAPTPLQQRRNHNTLLFQKLLNLRDGASPFTLVLDTLEQSGGPVIREFSRRAKISKCKIIFISYATLRGKLSFEADVFLTARSKTLASLRSEIISHLPPPTASAPSPGAIKYLLIIDTLQPLCISHPTLLSSFLSSLLTSPQTSLLGTYHSDVPIPASYGSNEEYQSSPLTTLLYLSTSILTISSTKNVLDAKRARDRSLPEPFSGLQEHREGAIVGLSNKNQHRYEGEMGIVVNMEIRRRSGRGIVENFVLIPSNKNSTKSTPPGPGLKQGTESSSSSSLRLSEIILLDDHPLFSPPSTISNTDVSTNASTSEEVETTFNLGLTEKQKRDREGVVLPYFDAQKDGGAMGPGDGGRILYEMGAEDREDFDDEEDEI